MSHVLALSHVLAFGRRREPDDPGATFAVFSLIAAAGFAVGWIARLLGGF